MAQQKRILYVLQKLKEKKKSTPEQSLDFYLFLWDFEVDVGPDFILK